MIRTLTTQDIDAFSELRLAALETHPESFATTANDWREAPPEKIEALLSRCETSADHAIWGAYQPRLAGMIGFSRETRQLTRHKGSLWGFFVRPEFRGQGLGRQLLATAVAYAGTLLELDIIRLTVTTANTKAISLFEQVGFVQYGLEPDAQRVNGRSYDRAYMLLKL